MSLLIGVGDFGIGAILAEAEHVKDEAQELVEELNEASGNLNQAVGEVAGQVKTQVLAQVQPTLDTIGANVAKRVVQVADLAALATMGQIQGTAMHVQDLDRGGFFKYEETGYTHNGGTVIGAAGGGAFVRQYDNYVNVRWFGAKGDGTTDDYAAFAAAIDWLKNSRSVAGIGQLAGTLFVPRGCYPLGTRLVVPDKVRLLGEGRGISVIQPLPSFNDSVFVELSNKNYGGKKNTFSNGLEHITINALGRTGIISVYSDEINEQSGLRNVAIYNLQHIGVQIKATGETAGVGAQNFYLEKMEIIFNNAETSTSRGIQIDLNGATFQCMRDISFVGKNATAWGVDISSASGWGASNFHMEGLARGFSLCDRGPVFGFTIHGIDVQNTCPCTVYIRGAVGDSYGYTLSGIRAAVNSQAVQDFRNQPTGLVNVPGPLGLYSVGREPYTVVTSRSVRSTSTMHERSFFRIEPRDPTTDDIQSGQKLTWQNSVANTVYDYINHNGTLKRSPAYVTV